MQPPSFTMPNSSTLLPLLTVAPQGVKVLFLLGLNCCAACREALAAGGGGSREVFAAMTRLTYLDVLQTVKMPSGNTRRSSACASAAAPLSGFSEAIAMVFVFYIYDKWIASVGWVPKARKVGSALAANLAEPFQCGSIWRSLDHMEAPHLSRDCLIAVLAAATETWGSSCRLDSLCRLAPVSKEWRDACREVG